MAHIKMRQVARLRVFLESTWDKWYCSATDKASDGHSVTRYLQHDGTWGECAAYFDDPDVLKTLMAKAEKPDFSLSQREVHARRMIRDDIDELMDYEPW